MSKAEYVTADSFFRNPNYTTIAEDVNRQILAENRAKPFCKTVAGHQGAQISGLSSKVFGAEGF